MFHYTNSAQELSSSDKSANSKRTAIGQQTDDRNIRQPFDICNFCYVAIGSLA